MQLMNTWNIVNGPTHPLLNKQDGTEVEDIQEQVRLMGTKLQDDINVKTTTIMIQLALFRERITTQKCQNLGQ